MSNITKRGTGGASITPSARPGIHSYREYPLNFENSMVRIGLGRDSDEDGESGNEQGLDEVDNVMSKPVHPIRSPSRQKKNIPRRNSLRSENAYSEDDETNLLSKSVPATLPSQLYCSDDSDDELPSRNEHQHSDVSYHSVASLNASHVNRNTSYNRTSDVLESAQLMNRDITPQSSSRIVLLLSVLGVAASVCYGMLKTSDMSNRSIYDEFKFYNDISGFGEKYNVDENSILQVQTGISTIFEKQDTGSFMFVYNSNSKTFNPNEFNKFLNDISFAASRYLRNDSTPVHYTIMEGTNLDMEEHSELIARYREDLHQTGVMLVRHIEAIPSQLAMAFHYYCDEYNPLVKKTAIFFTLNLAKCPQEPGKKSFHTLIEKCLTKKWSSVPVDSIGPLLTRVVSVVIDVTSAF